MNAAKQATWFLIALISLASSSWYFASSKPLFRLNQQILSTTADAIISNVTVQQFDAEGQLVHFLKTPVLRHVPFNNVHYLKTPHIIIKQPNQPAWEIHAEQATALHGGEKITFHKEVVIHQSKGPNTQESTLKTQTMTYYPKRQVATTRSKATFERPGSVVEATGMKAYLAEKRVTLVSKARSTYEPNHG